MLYKQSTKTAFIVKCSVYYKIVLNSLLATSMYLFLLLTSFSGEKSCSEKTIISLKIYWYIPVYNVKLLVSYNWAFLGV
jgi:hypothetical protein